MSRELKLSYHEFPSANEQTVFLHKTVVYLYSVSCRNELQKFLCNQYGLSAKLLLSGGPLRQPFKEPRICLHEAVCPITQDLGGHLKQPWRELAVLELAVLLVHRSLQPGQGKRLVTERAEVAVLCHLAVVDKPLTANPAS